MRSSLFEQGHQEVQATERFSEQNSQMLRVAPGEDVLAVKGSMVAFQSNVSFTHKGAGIMAGGLFDTRLDGYGTLALCTVGQPVLLDCRQQPTFVDVQACVAWSATLVPQVFRSMEVSPLVRGGSGEAFQNASHGDGFVVVQP